MSSTSFWDNLPPVKIEALPVSKITGNLGVKINIHFMYDVILRVSQAKYVPQGVTVRSWIEDDLYTASLSGKTLRTLEKNKRVLSVAVNKRLQVLRPMKAR